MVATLAQAASAAYYLESQRSFRHPNEYYTAGEEPDGVWFNPNGLFGLVDGGKVDSSDFHRLYHGFAPNGGGKLTRNAGSERRSAGLDMTFSADKSVSALWAIADPELRSKIEDAHNDAARVALEETVLRHCAYTRIRNRNGEIEVLPADISAAMFQHGTSRDNDPQLHTHCVIFNAARTHRDGKYRALHQHPVYTWMKAAGAVYRNALAWSLREHLGIRMEQYGKDGEFTRVAGMPEDLIGHWSKRRAAIIDAAREMGFTVEGNALRAAAANKITRAGKSPDNDPEIRHQRWRGEAAGYIEREALIASLLGKAEEITQEQVRALTAVLEDLPYRLTREEAVFRLPDIVERVGNATAGLLNRDAVATSIERVLLRVRPETLCRITEFSEHESNGREFDEGERVAVEVLPVLGQSAAAVEPGDGAFDHPTPGLDDEALHPIGSLDDLGLEIGQDAGQGAVKDRPLIGAVGEQFPEKGKQTEQGRQQRETAVAILNVGGGDDAVQQQALRIDQNMPLLALDQLAGIEAVAVDASPPFSALFTL